MAYEFTFRESFAEFFGLFSLVYFGGFSLILLANEKIDLTEVALLHTFVIGILSISSYAYCRSQFNPLVTMVLLL